MRKLVLLLVIAGAGAAGACQRENPVGPGNIETLRRPPNEAPIVTITGPSDESNVPAGARVILTGTANDEEGELASQLTWHSSLDGRLGTGARLRVVLNPGTHAITASVTDAEGASGSATITVMVAQAMAPVVTITAPGDGAMLPTGSVVTFVATAVDPEEGDLTDRLRWHASQDGALGRGGSVTASLSDGAQSVSASVTDRSGLTGTAAILVTLVAEEMPPNMAPVVMITSPEDGLEVPSGTVLAFTATAVDAEDGDLSAHIQWQSSQDGELGSGPGPVVTVALSDGTHSISARVTDSGGIKTVVAITVTLVP